MCDRLIVLSLLFIKYAKVVDRVCTIDVIDSECILVDPQCPFIMCDRLIVLSLLFINYAKVVDRVGTIDVIDSECILADPQYLFILSNCIKVPTL